MEQQYTCVIIDDEPKAIEQLADMITELYSNISISGRYTDWKNAFDFLKRQYADIVFLDIAMPQKTGIAMLRLLPQLESEVIFVTADPAHALEAFDLQAAGYILKPLDDLALIKCIDKALARVTHKRLARTAAPIPVSSRIGIPNDNGIEYINPDEIIYIKGITRYTQIKTGDRELLSSYSLGKFREIIDSHLLFQVHRSFIININFVQRYDSSGIVVMTDGSEIPVTKKMRAAFLNLFRKVVR